MNCTNWLSHSAKIVLVFALILPLVELSNAPASAQGLELWNKNCRKLYETWKSKAKHKAFAVSNAHAGGGDTEACGASWGVPTKSAAESAAIKSCMNTHYGNCWVTKSE